MGVWDTQTIWHNVSWTTNTRALGIELRRQNVWDWICSQGIAFPLDEIAWVSSLFSGRCEVQYSLTDSASATVHSLLNNVHIGTRNQALFWNWKYVGVDDSRWRKTTIVFDSLEKENRIYFFSLHYLRCTTTFQLPEFLVQNALSAPTQVFQECWSGVPKNEILFDLALAIWVGLEYPHPPPPPPRQKWKLGQIEDTWDLSWSGLTPRPGGGLPNSL